MELPRTRRKIDILVWVQGRRVTKVVRKLEYLTCEKRMRALGWFVHPGEEKVKSCC